jgi:hypothetical protein
MDTTTQELHERIKTLTQLCLENRHQLELLERKLSLTEGFVRGNSKTLGLFAKHMGNFGKEAFDSNGLHTK